jgi:hypothetical protein
MSKTHQPKGGMCRSCVKVEADCSGLPFETMPVIDKTTLEDKPVVIVRCTEFKRQGERNEQ